MLQIPHRSLSFRWVLILNGLTIFLWTGIEDNHTTPVTLLGIITTINLIATGITSKWSGNRITKRQALMFGGLFGAISGVGGGLLTVLLMLLKNARHAHLVPDFSSQQMGDSLANAPLWGLVGGVMGIGLVLAWIGLHRSRNPGLYSGTDSHDDTERHHPI